MGTAQSKGTNTLLSKEAMTDSVKTGNHVYLQSGIFDQIKGLSDELQSLGKSDFSKLQQDVERINEMFKDKDFKLSDSMTSALMEYHKALLMKLDKDQSRYTKENRDTHRAEYDSILKNPKDNQKYSDSIKSITNNNGKDDVTKIFNALKEYYAEDIDDVFETFNKAAGIKGNDQVKNSVAGIAENIKNMKVKYRFFEYRYIQMNIFMLMFIQHTYDTIEKFTKDVIEFNKQRDNAREEAINDFINSLTTIMKSADMRIDEKDFNQLDALMNDMTSNIKSKQDDFNSKLRDIQQITQDNIKGFISALSDATKVEIQDHLNQTSRRPEYTRPSGQRGGFIRGSSMMPKAFYEFDASTAGSEPRPSE